MPFTTPARDEYEAGTDRQPLIGGEWYRGTVISADITPKAEYQTGIMKDKLVLKVDATSFADGEQMIDIHKDVVPDGRWLWADVDHLHMGFKKDGTPAKARQAVYSIFGIADLNTRLEGWEPSQLLGRQVEFFVEVRQNQKGEFVNRIEKWRPVGAGRRAAPVSVANPAFAAAMQSVVTAPAPVEADAGGVEEVDLPF